MSPSSNSGTFPPAGASVDADTTFIAPRELALRWRCSRSQVDRIARRANFTRMCLGGGHNGMVRYLRKEVEHYESTRRT